MFPFIKIGAFALPLYGTIFVIGFLTAMLIARKTATNYGGKVDDTTYASVYAAIGIFVGSKLVYFFTKLPNIISNFDAFKKLWSLSVTEAFNYCFGGFVFYGGLIGAILMVLLYSKQYKEPILPLLDIFAPLIPLVHGIGRIGCFCAGCCYGIEYHGFLAVNFPKDAIIPHLADVPRFPVQLFEAGLNFIVFGILFTLGIKGKFKRGQMMGWYLLYYTIARFFLEMLRGDKIRGSVGVFSTSQLISLILLPIAIYLLSGKFAKLVEKKNKK